MSSTDSKQATRQEDWPAGLLKIVASKTYCWRRMIRGIRESCSLGTKNLTEATKLADQINTNIEDKKMTVKQAIENALGISKKDFEGAVEVYLTTTNKRESTRKRYAAAFANVLRIFRALLGRETVMLSDITSDMLEDYKISRMKEPVSRNGHQNARKTLGAGTKTIKEERRLTKSLLDYAYQRGWINFIPKEVSLKGKAEPRESAARPLEASEILLLLEAAKKYDLRHASKEAYPTWYHDCFKTYIYSGLRSEELQYLEWKDINFDIERIHVRKKILLDTRRIELDTEKRLRFEELIRSATTGKLLPDTPSVLKAAASLLNTRKPEILRSLKNADYLREQGVVLLRTTMDWAPKSKDASVPIHPAILSTLASLKGKHPSNFVFPEKDGGCWRKHIRNHLIRVAEMARLHDFTRIHDLRHTTGTMLRRNGVALESIMGILRHQNIKETLIYAEYNLEEGREAIRKLPNWD